MQDVLLRGISKDIVIVSFVIAFHRVVIGLREREHPLGDGGVVVQVEIAQQRIQRFRAKSEVHRHDGVTQTKVLRYKEIVFAVIVDDIPPMMKTTLSVGGEDDLNNGILEELF